MFSTKVAIANQPFTLLAIYIMLDNHNYIARRHHAHPTVTASQNYMYVANPQT
jgi:hypothetical protein